MGKHWPASPTSRGMLRAIHACMRDLRVFASVLDRLNNGELSVERAASLLDISRTTLWRKARRYAARGELGLVHGLANRRSNRAYSPAVKAEVLAFVSQLRASMPTLPSLRQQHRACLATCSTPLKRAAAPTPST